MPTHPAKPHPRRPASQEPPEVVDPRWILKALAVVLFAAILCAYVTVCGLFSYGQWQLVLHPSRTVTQTPESLGLAFSEVHLGVDASGQPQLDGWWIPSGPSDPTALILHAGSGSISDALPDARTLHEARLNVLLFDYRGFGKSGGKHPTQALMEADAASAFSYLTQTRNIPVSSLVVFARGAGASPAITLAASQKDIPALILIAPEGDFKAQIAADPRYRFIPTNSLFHQDFPVADPLRTLSTPKLLISFTNTQTPTALAQAADPKMTVELKSEQDAQNLHQTLRRFLDTYIAQPASTLIPSP